MGSSKNSDNVSEYLAPCWCSARTQKMLVRYPFPPHPLRVFQSKEIHAKYTANLVQAEPWSYHGFGSRSPQ